MDCLLNPLYCIVSENVTVGFKESTITVAEDSSDPAVLCVQICPGEQSPMNGTGGTIIISTSSGSATGKV